MLILHSRLNSRDGVIEACDEWTTRVALLVCHENSVSTCPRTLASSLLLDYTCIVRYLLLIPLEENYLLLIHMY